MVTREHRERAVVTLTGVNYACQDEAAEAHWAATGELPDDPNHEDGPDLETVDAVAQSYAQFEATIHTRYAGLVEAATEAAGLLRDRSEYELAERISAELDKLKARTNG